MTERKNSINGRVSDVITAENAAFVKYREALKALGAIHSPERAAKHRDVLREHLGIDIQPAGDGFSVRMRK